MSLAICYCVLTDRTQIFYKQHKRYLSQDFMVMILVVVALGVLSIRRSVHTPIIQGQQATTREIDQPLLSRDQTDEWKGWMQFVILIYHYTGASRVLGIYKIIRLLVASYLFMTGFGHAAFFYRRSDYSLRRSAAVLIRINLLSSILPYAMRTDYPFYYFAPLTSSWYMIIYLTMRFNHGRNTSVRFLLAKVVVSAILVTGVVRVPGVLEAVFQCLKVTARVHWNLTEWRFRMGLDLYIVYAGMLSAIAVIKMSEPGNVMSQILFTRLRMLSIVLAFATLAVVWVAVKPITEKPEYNSWVPYISFLPILSFVILRNCSRHLRNFYSSIFAWLGRYSLETFTLQYHIWLAADTKGVLSLGLGRLWDLLLLTAIFLWVSWHVGNATNVITSWIVVPSEGRQHIELGASRLEVDLPSHKDPPAQPLTWRYWLKRTLLRENLRIRLAVIVLFMWMLNLLY